MPRKRNRRRRALRQSDVVTPTVASWLDESVSRATLGAAARFVTVAAAATAAVVATGLIPARGALAAAAAFSAAGAVYGATHLVHAFRPA